MMKVVLAVALLGYLSQVGWAIPVDNGVEGDPEIECGPTSITVNFNTKNTFEGHVYVKGLYDQEAAGCRNSEGGRQVAGIELDFSTCNVRRTRSLNPKGVFVSTTVIVSFHPLFLTKVDRAYRIQCFYMEADKTVDTRLEVSMLTTEFETQLVPMPVCRYEIFDEAAGGSLIEYAIVGQQVYHQWTCDSETVDTFCMVVHSCFVDDTNGDKVDLIDPNGCASDVYLINNIEYSSDLQGGVEAHVFKYADRADLYFQCQITILVKEPNQQCPRPVCPSPAGRGAGGANPQEGNAPPPPQHPFPLLSGSPYRPGGPGIAPSAPRGRSDNRGFRGKRNSPLLPWTYHDSGVGELDVSVDLNTLDISDKKSEKPNLRRLESDLLSQRSSSTSLSSDFCLSMTTFGVFTFCVVTSLMTVVVSLGCYLTRPSKQ